MNDQHQVTGPLPSSEDQRALIQRIIASGWFQRSPRQRTLLLFIAEEHFAGRSAEIHEQMLGQHVFGRQPGYNQSDDNIVRVAARQLRVRLQHYFENEGRDEDWQVDIPKGRYRLAFHYLPDSRERPAQPAARSGWMSPFPAWLSWRAHTLGAVAIGAACLSIGFVLGGDHRSAALSRAAAATPPPASAIEELLTDTRRVNVVVADSALVLMQALIGRIPSVEDYARNPVFLAPASLASTPAGSLPGLIGAMQFTSLADVSFLARMLQTGDPLRKRIRVRHARDLNASDLRVDDLVILGGPRVNPWAGLFEANLNFRFHYNGVGPGCFSNQDPKPGEQNRYGNCEQDDAGDYARIAWLPNLGRTGRVLMISGNSMLATESASDFLMDAGSSARLRAIVGAESLSRIETLELLLHVPHRAGVPSGSRLLASRIRRSENQ